MFVWIETKSLLTQQTVEKEDIAPSSDDPEYQHTLNQLSSSITDISHTAGGEATVSFDLICGHTFFTALARRISLFRVHSNPIERCQRIERQ